MYLILVAIPYLVGLIIYWFEAKDLWNPREGEPSAWEMRLLIGPVLSLAFPASQITDSISRDQLLVLIIVPVVIGVASIGVLMRSTMGMKFDEGRLTLRAVHATRGAVLVLACLLIMALETVFALATWLAA